MVAKCFKLFAHLVLVGLLAGLPVGCVSQSKIRSETHKAYLAGQREALLQMQQSQMRGPTVTFIGPVQHSVVNWTENLTLAQAITTAVYRDPTDPMLIIIHRSGGEIPIKTKHLLEGEDMPLLSGDVIEFR